MQIIIAFFGGIRGDYLLLAIFGLSFCTMTYGWVAEALSRPDKDSRLCDDPAGVQDVLVADSDLELRACGRMHYWEIGSPLNKRDLLLWGCWPGSAALQRLGPNLLGYVPYAVSWFIIFDMFYANVSRADEDRRPPDWVYGLVWGQFVVFSSFAVVSLVQLSSHWGCRNYYWGEVAYLVLSMVSKGLLGSILMANILLSSAGVDESALPEEQRDTVLATLPECPPSAPPS